MFTNLSKLPDRSELHDAFAAASTWIADTGSADHLRNRNDLNRNELKGPGPMRRSVQLGTANGKILAKDETTIEFGSLPLPASRAIVLGDIPDVFSIGRYVEHHEWHFLWSPTGCYLLHSDGERRVEFIAHNHNR